MLTATSFNFTIILLDVKKNKNKWKCTPPCKFTPAELLFAKVNTIKTEQCSI